MHCRQETKSPETSVGPEAKVEESVIEDGRQEEARQEKNTKWSASLGNYCALTMLTSLPCGTVRFRQYEASAGVSRFGVAV